MFRNLPQILFFSLLLLGGIQSFAEELTLSVQGGLVSLQAENIALADILYELQRYYPEVDPESVEDRNISWVCEDLPVDKFLAKLGVNFMGVYKPGGTAVKVMTLGSRLEAIMDEVDIEPELRAKILELLKSLEDDDIRFNATSARWSLIEMGAVVAPFMQKALDSEDYQTRQFSAEVLVGLGTNATRTAKLDSVIIEGMADDEYPAGEDSTGAYRYSYLNNAKRALNYFGNDAEAVARSKPMLRATLDSADGQQRLLAAWALGLHGHDEYVVPVARILISHLADNEISSDSRLAMNALFGLGEPVRPLLEPYIHSDDKQQAGYAREILDFLGTDAGSPRYRRVSMQGWEPEYFPPKP